MDADQLDLKITGHVVTPGRVLEDGWIGVRGEIVAGLGPAGSAAPAARQVIDARGQWILPGAVDAHVHCFSEPAEGFTHATRAAAAGGAAQVGDVAGPRGLRAAVDLLSREEPLSADPAVCSVLAEAADRTGRPYLRLPSHAGHDANQMAKIAPVGMLFAPSRDGRSHCPEEWTEPDDIAVCLDALAAAVIRLDEELAP